MKTIMLIDENGTKLGDDFTLEMAQQIAKDKELDLMLVNPNKQIYKICDKGKLAYDKKQKTKLQKAKQRAQKIKEIQIRPTTDKGDLDTKLRRIKEFLEDGMKTKLVMKFKRSQLSYKDIGMEKVNALVDQLVQEGLADVEKAPKFNGDNILVFLNPSKEQHAK